jgi:hypothetical protein
MKLSQLRDILAKAETQHGPDLPILLCYETGAMEEGYDESSTEGISDVRVVDDWPLPGASLVTYEGEKPKKLIIFYENHYKLDSSLVLES